MGQTPQAPKVPETSQPKSKKTMYGIVGAVVIIVVVVVALYLGGIFGGGGALGTPVTVYNKGSSCSSASTCGYAPTPLSISVGTKVTWTSNTTTPHTVTACSTTNGLDTTYCPTPNASNLLSFDSGPSGFSMGQTPFSYTFSTAGTYYYACRIHYWMHAQVNVS
jgi:plastocyanin